MIYDVSMPLREGMPVYAGNPPFRRIWTRQGPINESRLEMGAHCGTHVDAPLHFRKGVGVDAIPLESLVGPARVMEFARQDSIDLPDLERMDWRGVERVLFKTRTSERWRRGEAFDGSCVYLTGAAADFLARRVKLVGTDGLAIDRFGSVDHPAHHALLGAGVTVIEGLCLSEVRPGDYTLFCGPLRIVGADGAPARVLLSCP